MKVVHVFVKSLQLLTLEHRSSQEIAPSKSTLKQDSFSFQKAAKSPGIHGPKTTMQVSSSVFQTPALRLGFLVAPLGRQQLMPYDVPLAPELRSARHLAQGKDFKGDAWVDHLVLPTSGDFFFKKLGLNY